MATNSAGRGILERISNGLSRGGDITLAVAFLMVIGMIILPLPAVLLDVLLMIDIVLSLLIFMMVLSVNTASEFSVYPTVLLIMTLFRLALNISSTRLILTQGTGFESRIIRAFGDFVVAGNLAVGVIIFAIIILVQFLVITKGAKRVSEVRARFTLDAMNPKMMAIDAKVNSGAISEDEAEEERQKINRDSEFYGAMDGASNFVQGDVIAGIVITIINILGGLVVGMVMRGESLTAAVEAYIRFTVGDGLVSQIPALVMSYATGMLIVRSASDSSIGKDVATQVLSSPRNLFVAAGFTAIMAFLPGFPTVILLLLAVGIGALGYLVYQQQEEVLVAQGEAESEVSTGPLDVSTLTKVEPIELSIGANLIPLVDESGGGDLLNRVTNTRRELALEMGMVVPPVHITDNEYIEPEEYVININGTEMAKGYVRASMLLALKPAGGIDDLDGEQTTEPAFGLPALWIKYEDRDKAEMKGCMVFSPTAVIATHLTETIKRHAPLLLGRQEVQKLLDQVRTTHPTLVEEATKATGALGYIQKVMQNLLREGVSIRNSIVILESVADVVSEMGPDQATEFVRSRLSHQISKQFASQDGVIRVLNLSQSLQDEIAASLTESGDGRGTVIAMDLEKMRSLLSKLREGRTIAQERGYEPVVLSLPLIRRALQSFADKNIGGVPVLATTEVAPGYKVEPIARID